MRLLPGPLVADSRTEQPPAWPGLQVPVSKEEFEAKKAARAARFGAAAGSGGGGAAAGKSAELSEEEKKKLEERAKRWARAAKRACLEPAGQRARRLHDRPADGAGQPESARRI